MLESIEREGVEFLDVHFPTKGLHTEVKFKIREDGKLSNEYTRTLHTYQGGVNFFYFEGRTIFL